MVLMVPVECGCVAFSILLYVRWQELTEDRLDEHTIVSTGL